MSRLTSIYRPHRIAWPLPTRWLAARLSPFSHACSRQVFGLACLLLALSAALLWIGPTPALAQEAWQPDEFIPDYTDYRAPELLADPSGTIHAFYDQAVGDDVERFLFYRTWTAEQGWGKPVDVLLSPVCCTLKVLGVHLDEAGVFHLVLFAGNPPDAGALYYATAPATLANSAQVWSKPKMIAADAGPLVSGAMGVNAAGDFVVLYAGNFDGPGLYQVRSTDGGVTWSEQELLALPPSQDTTLAHPRLLLDREGALHAVWDVINSRGLGDEVQYARQEAGQTTWSTPVTLAQREPEHAAGFGATWPSIIEHQGELFLFFEDGTGAVGIPPAMWVRRSSDGGVTWSEAEQPFPQVGGYEQALLLEDGGGVLHAFFGGRLGDPIVGGLWHSQWNEGRWTEPEAVASSIGKSAEEQRLFGPSGPRAAISRGNTVLLTWWNDASEKTAASYSFGTLDAPELAASALPTPVATSTPPPRPTSAAATPPAARSSLAQAAPPAPEPLNSAAPLGQTRPGSTILWGALLLLALNGAVILARRVRSLQR